jgi:hypothetical protein
MMGGGSSDFFGRNNDDSANKVNESKQTYNSGKNFELKPKRLTEELANSGVKYNPENVVAVAKTKDGKLVWLEKGDIMAGLIHIYKHAAEFEAKGIAQSQLPEFIIKSVSEGEIVAYQGKDTGRPIYEITFNGKRYRVAITTGSNGFIVGANPVSIR